MKTEKEIKERLKHIEDAISGGKGYLHRIDVKRKERIKLSLKTLEYMKKEYLWMLKDKKEVIGK